MHQSPHLKKIKYNFNLQNKMAWNPLSFEFKTLKSHDCTGARRTNSLLQFKTDFITKLDENRFVPAGHLSRQQCAQSETPEISYKKLKYIG